jgi:Mg-chelatase subunit ChlD
MKYDDYSVVLFESEARLLKPFAEDVPIEEMIESIFNLKPSGYTNIDASLRRAHEELTTMRRQDKWAVLVTDGDYNQGDDPRHRAGMFRRLNVIRVGSIRKGETVCKDLAHLGHGKYENVSDYRNLPMALLRIMR